MASRSNANRLQRLREQEQQLAARRRALEAVMAKAAGKRVLRGSIVIGRAVQAAMQSNAALAAVLPQRLLPFISEADRACAVELFNASIPKE
jgi:hypothetical protein